MFLNKIRRLPHTLALRLTIWYAAIFAISSTLAFAFVYLLISTFIAERTNEDLREDVGQFSAFFREGGVARVKAEMLLDTKGQESTHAFFRLWSEDGRPLAATDLSSWAGLDDVPAEIVREAAGSDAPLVETINLPARSEGIRRIFGSIGPGLVLEIGLSLEEDEELIATILHGFLFTLTAVFLLGAPVGWFMARRALRAIDKVTQTASEISHGALDQRVAVESQGDELDHLAQTFNAMLDRIQTLIVGMREMTDNLAHDLRSPLARMRAAAEMALTDNERKAERGALAVNIIEECDRLLEIINTTLDIAEAESGAAKLKISAVDFVDVVLGACDLFQTVAEDNRVVVTTELPKTCCIPGDRQRLQRVMSNLLDNALKYTPAGGRVAISLVEAGPQIRLSIADTGVGVSAEELPRIFERFYRCDRSRGQGGNGLGLSLALAIVHAHGGDIAVTSTLGKGSVFTVVLPRSLPVRAPTTADDMQSECGIPIKVDA